MSFGNTNIGFGSKGSGGGGGGNTGWDTMLAQNQMQSAFRTVNLNNNGIEFNEAGTWQINTSDYPNGLFYLDNSGNVFLGNSVDANKTYLQIATADASIMSFNSNDIQLMYIDENLFETAGHNYPNGFTLIDSNNRLIQLGDYNRANNNTYLTIDDGNQTIYCSNSTNEGNIAGFYFDFDNNKYIYGDLDRYNNTNLTIDDDQSFIKTYSDTNYSGDAAGLNLDFRNELFELGDFNSNRSGTYLAVDDGNQKIYTMNNGGARGGIDLDFDANNYTFGDINNENNTQLYIDDGLRTVSIRSTDYGDGMLGINMSNGNHNNMDRKSVYVGDWASNNNGNYFKVDDDQNFIRTYSNQNYAGTNAGLNCNFNERVFSLGDNDGSSNGVIIEANDGTGNINTYYQGNNRGLRLDFTDDVYFFGNWYTSTGISLIVYDNAKTVVTGSQQNYWQDITNGDVTYLFANSEGLQTVDAVAGLGTMSPSILFSNVNSGTNNPDNLLTISVGGTLWDIPCALHPL